MSNLFSKDRWEFFPINQLISFVFQSICFLFVAMCSFQFNLQFKWVLCILLLLFWGRKALLMLIAGQWPFRSVNFMCDDLDSLAFIFIFFSHFSMMFKCSWRLSEAIIGSWWVANIAVSSANVPNVVSLNVGKSGVYSTQRRGPRMFPWGTSEWMWKWLEVSPLIFVSQCRPFRDDFSRLKYLECIIHLILNSSPGFHNLSNAWLTSKDAALQYCWLSIALLMLSVLRWHCCTVEWACRNPSWWFGIQSCGFKSLLIFLV
jgi:hypothetical protein